jgi:metal-responsive CopG/Arc/MetJ family transcriptional regulator
MTINEDKHRFVVIIEKEIFEEFKEQAQRIEKRSASNLAAKLISDYVNAHKDK